MNLTQRALNSETLTEVVMSVLVRGARKVDRTGAKVGLNDVVAYLQMGALNPPPDNPSPAYRHCQDPCSCQ